MKSTKAFMLPALLLLMAGTVLGQSGGNNAGLEWPDNEFTRAVPKPEIAIASARVYYGDYEIVFSGATYAAVKAYGGQLKAAGFTVNLGELDRDDVYQYRLNAHNSAGYRVILSFNNNSPDTSDLMIKRAIKNKREEGKMNKGKNSASIFLFYLFSFLLYKEFYHVEEKSFWRTNPFGWACAGWGNSP
jgi:hypothetical protein